jgi:hypothetical protein
MRLRFLPLPAECAILDVTKGGLLAHEAQVSKRAPNRPFGTNSIFVACFLVEWALRTLLLVRPRIAPAERVEPMAQKTIVHLVDDLDGGPAEESVAFALDGQAYEIDLSAKNAARLRDTLAEFVASARKPASGGRAQRRSTPAQRRSSNGTGEVRSWARENGYQISERGRIPGSVIEAYRSAH